jgi:putative hemolysin
MYADFGAPAAFFSLLREEGGDQQKKKKKHKCGEINICVVPRTSAFDFLFFSGRNKRKRGNQHCLVLG